MEKITRNTKWLLVSDDVEEMLGTEEEQKEQYCECCDIDPQNVEEVALQQWCYGCIEGYWEDFFFSLDKDQQCLLIADLGLWDGRRAGGKIGGIESLVRQGAEDYNSIYYFPKDGHMEIKAVHHDGTNYYKIYALGAEGRRYANEHCYDDDRTVHNHLLHNKSKYFEPITYTNL